MMRCVATLLGLLCLFLPATAQPQQGQGPAASPAPVEWSYAFTSEHVKSATPTPKPFRLPDGRYLCSKDDEPMKDVNGKPLQELSPQRALSLNDEAPLNQQISVSADVGCKAGSLQAVTIKTLYPLLRPDDLNLANAVLDGDAPRGTVRLLITPASSLPARLVKSTRLSLKIGPASEPVQSELGSCVGSEPVCTQIAFAVSGLPEAQAVHSVSVLGTRSSLNLDGLVGGGKQVFFAGTGGPFQAAELPSTEPSTISVWKFNELETAASPVNAKATIPFVTVPWVPRTGKGANRVSIDSPLLRLLSRSDGGEKSLKCVESGKATRDCAMLAANSLTLTTPADLKRLQPGGAGLVLLGHLPDLVSIYQRAGAKLSDSDFAIRILPVECSYSFKQLTVATAGFHSVEVLYQVNGTDPLRCPMPSIAEVAAESGIRVLRQPTRWRPAGQNETNKEAHKRRLAILSLVLEEVKGDPNTYPLTFKFDADNEIKPEKPASLQVDAAPKFNDPLRVFVQSPFVGSSYAMTSSAPSDPAAPAEGKPSKGHDAASSPHQGFSALLPTPEPKATADRESVPGIVLVDAIATNRNTFFEFGTGKQRGWHLQIRSKGHRSCRAEHGQQTSQVGNADEMMFYSDLGVSGAYCLVGMQDASKLELRVVRSGGAGSANDRELALDAAAVEIIKTHGGAMEPINGGWADFTVALATKPFRLALNLAHRMSFRCVDPELRAKGSNDMAGDPCLDHEEESSTHPRLLSGAAVYAYSYGALKHCALRIDMLDEPEKAKGRHKTDWPAIQQALRDWDVQRLQISIGLAKTDKDTFQSQTLNEAATLVLDPARPQQPDWAEKTTGRRICKRIDLTQGDRINIEPYGRVQLVAEHQDKGLYRSDLDFSAPGSRFEVIVRRKPMYGVGATKYTQITPNLRGKLFCKERVLDWRTYVSIPLSLTLLRGPSSGSTSKVSSDIDVPEVAGFGVGAIGIFEPWNYHQNRPIWGGLGPQIHLGLLTTLPYNALQDTKSLVYPSVSIVGGFGLRLPPSVSPSGSGGGVEAALNAIIWGELMVVSSAPQWRENYRPIPAVLFGLIGQFGAVGN